MHICIKSSFRNTVDNRINVPYEKLRSIDRDIKEVYYEMLCDCAKINLYLKDKIKFLIILSWSSKSIFSFQHIFTVISSQSKFHTTSPFLGYFYDAWKCNCIEFLQRPVNSWCKEPHQIAYLCFIKLQGNGNFGLTVMKKLEALFDVYYII